MRELPPSLTSQFLFSRADTRRLLACIAPLLKLLGITPEAYNPANPIQMPRETKDPLKHILLKYVSATDAVAFYQSCQTLRQHHTPQEWQGLLIERMREALSKHEPEILCIFDMYVSVFSHPALSSEKKLAHFETFKNIRLYFGQLEPTKFVTFANDLELAADDPRLVNFVIALQKKKLSKFITAAETVFDVGTAVLSSAFYVTAMQTQKHKTYDVSELDYFIKDMETTLAHKAGKSKEINPTNLIIGLFLLAYFVVLFKTSISDFKIFNGLSVVGTGALGAQKVYQYMHPPRHTSAFFIPVENNNENAPAIRVANKTSLTRTAL
jgi:hypothetical protein